MRIGVRSGFSLTTAASLVGATALAGIVVTAIPASAAVTPVANPDLTPKCGMTVAVVLDASGSIGNNNGYVREAARTFLTSLSGTGSSAAVIQFGAVAKVEAPYAPVTDVSLQTGGAFNTALTNYYTNRPAISPRSGHKFNRGTDFFSTGNYDNASDTQNGDRQYTNWQDALLAARTLPGGLTGRADLVVFLTDGDPTAVNSLAPADSGATQNYPFLGTDPDGDVLINIPRTGSTNQEYTHDPAVIEANRIRGAGTKILTVGVGTGLSSASSQQRLKDVSGPDVADLDEGDVADLVTDDLILTEEFEKLSGALTDIATGLCRSSLTISKEAQGAGHGAYVPAADWTFSTTAVPSTGTLTWTNPDGATNPAVVTTGADGKASFQWRTSVSNATTTLTVTETGKDEFLPLSAVTCQVRRQDASVTQLNPQVTNGTFTLTDIASTDIVTCTASNSFDYAPGIELAKSASPEQVRTDVEPPTPVTYTYTATNTGNTPLANVTLVDDRCASPTLTSGDTNGDDRLDTDETWIFTCIQTFAGLTGDPVVNSATVAGVDPAGTRVESTDTATVTLLSPSLTVAKAASATVVSPGTEVTYTFTVTNTGNTDLTDVTVTDTVGQGPGCTPAYISGDTGGDSVMEPTEVWVFTCTSTLTTSTINTATATGTPPVGPEITSPPDTATVDVVPVGIELAKTVNGQEEAQVHAGDTVTYTFTVTIPPTAGPSSPVSNVIVDDPLCASDPALTGGDTNGDSILQPTETWVYTCTKVITEDTPNTATVTGTATLVDEEVTDSDTALVTVLAPGVGITKSADPTLAHAGDTITYTIIVTNLGNTPLLNVSVTDDTCVGLTRTGGDTNGDNRLDLTETWTYTCTATPDDDVENTAMVTAEDAIGGPNGTVSESAKADVVILNPEISVAKAANKTTVRVGEEVTYTYEVTNTGDAPLSNVSIADDVCVDWSWEPGENRSTFIAGDLNRDGVLDVAETWVATCTQILNATTTNTVIATGTDALGDEVDSDPAQATVTVIDPSLSVVKVPSAETVRNGDEVTYTYTVTNTSVGDAAANTITDVTLVDDKCSEVTPTAGVTLAPGEDAEFSCTMTLTATTDNIATATGTATDGGPVLGTDTATVTVLTPGITVTKTPDKTIVDPGGRVTYTYGVTNSGQDTLTDVTVTDTITDASGTRPGCSPVTPASVATLAPGANATFTCTTTLDVDTVNTATASGQPSLGGDPVTNTATATVTVVPSGIVLTKTADAQMIDFEDGTRYAAHEGDDVTYTYQVTNPEVGALSAVTVTDDQCSPVAYVEGDDGDSLLEQGETWTYTCTKSITANEETGGATNTATATGTTPGGGTARDTDTVFIEVIDPSIALVKTASPTVVRPGETVTYTITITNDGDVPLTIPEGAPQDLQCGELSLTDGDNSDLTLDPGESWTFQCSVIVTESVENTATVAGEDPLGEPVDGEGSASVDVQDPRLAVTKVPSSMLVNPGTEVTYTITAENTSTNAPLTDVTVTDAVGNGPGCTNIQGPVGDGTADAVLDPGETWTYTCSAVITEDTTNTATVTGTHLGQEVPSSASATVVIARADIAVSKTTDTPIVDLGGTGTFRVTANNLGPDPATGVTVTDVLPDGLTFVSADASQGAYDAGTGIWTVGDLAVGAPATLDLTVTVASAASVLENTASVGDVDQEDPNPDNDTDTAAVTQEASLRVTKTADPESVQVGQTSTFTVTVINDGPSKATGVVLTDSLPEGLEFVSAEVSQGTFDSASGTWAVGELAVGDDATLTLVARALTAGVHTNLAAATAEQTDPGRTSEAEATVEATESAPTPTPTPPPSGGGEGLPDTGGGRAVDAARLGLALVVLGTAMVAVAAPWRRRSES